MGRTKLSVILIIVCAVKCLAMTYDELEDLAEHINNTSLLSLTKKDAVYSYEDYDDDEVVSDNAWEESGKFEGDLILNGRQRTLILEEVAEDLASRNGFIDAAMRWPNNEVIYHIIVAHFSNDQLQAIRKGIEKLAKRTCIKFRPYKKGDRDMVIIQGSRHGCFSQVGYQGGYQLTNLCARHRVGTGCFRSGTIVHELLHVLGFFHMHSSPERDDYVDIVWENIAHRRKKNFKKYQVSEVSNFGVGYDYESCLHYSRMAFSANGKTTIVPTEGSAVIGQRESLSEKDVQKVIKMYCDTNTTKTHGVENAPEGKKEFSFLPVWVDTGLTHLLSLLQSFN